MLYSDYQTASSRLQGYHVHDYLRGRGWNSHLLLAPPHMISGLDMPTPYEPSVPFGNSGDIVVFQKLHGPRTSSWIQSLRRRGMRTIFVDCDMPLKLDEARLVDRVVTPSEALATAYRSCGIDSVVQIPDAAECFQRPILRANDQRTRRCVWFGFWVPSRRADVEFARELVSQVPDLELTVISTSDDADVGWDLETFFDHLAEYDFSLLPVVDHGSIEARVKSANRATQSMAVGVPVAASPLPAYTHVVEHGKNGYLCNTTEDWLTAIDALMDESRRYQIASNGYEFAAANYSMDRIGPRWEQLLVDVAGISARRRHGSFRDRRRIAAAATFFSDAVSGS